MEPTSDRTKPSLPDLGYDTEAEAEYTLESPVRCSSCGEFVEKVHVVRLLRTRVNFTSSLPRRGCVVICPSCRTMVPAAVG
jgi:hypothetical protein